MLFHKLSATSLGIGYIGKGAGTAAAVVTALVWYGISTLGYEGFLPAFFATIMIIALGIWSGNVVEPLWGKDHNRVVIDEVAGMCITLLWISPTPVNILVGLLLFRFFDILKPLGIKQAEKLPSGYGIMADDILSGIYGGIVILLYRFVCA